MRRLLFVFSLLCTGFVMAQTELFDAGNEAYRKGNYEEAIQKYDSIISQDLESDHIYYNLGNAHYKLNHLANAVYNYEKALQLNPANTDVKVNLAYAQRSLIDVIEPLPKTFFQKLNEQFISVLSVNSWTYLSVVFLTLVTLSWLLFFFTSSSARKKLWFSLALFFIVLSLVSLAITNHQYNKEQTTQFAIVFELTENVKSEPTNAGSTLFTLHEGTKLQVLDEVGTWYKVKIADGQEGWIDKGAIKLL